MIFSKEIEAISAQAFEDEYKLIEGLMPHAAVFQGMEQDIFNRAKLLVEKIRDDAEEDISIEKFMNEYSLDSYEGVSILCLAEALLRIPDSDTADALIKDKINKGDWDKHLHSDAGLLINSSTYALMLGGEILGNDNHKTGLSKAVSGIVKRLGEPVIREALKKGVEILGSKFVLGSNLERAFKKAEKLEENGFLFSFDMLGESARTAEQAAKFFEQYKNAILAISGKFKQTEDFFERPNISIKLSALHPRYELSKHERVEKELFEKLKELCLLAKQNHISISIDAEESFRFDLALALFEKLHRDEDFKGFEGLGYVVQAYGKRAYTGIKFLKNLSDELKRKIPVRLVKGAYWDAELKHAQMHGLEGYAVYTRKSHTELSYLVCAKYMLENKKNFYPQFATHSALTYASIKEFIIGNNIHDNYEFQKLYGMGDVLHGEIVQEERVRIYAPVGRYEELLPYLIRRILENGANNSFVNLAVDKKEPIGEILTNPIDKILKKAYTSKNQPMPADLYAPSRKNSQGYDLGNLVCYKKFEKLLENDLSKNISAKSIVSGAEIDTIGEFEIKEAINNNKKYFKTWSRKTFTDRAKILEKLADKIEDNSSEVKNEILNILCHEGKRKMADCISEVREAVDFLRFYASQAKKLDEKNINAGYTGEKSRTEYVGKGVFVCIAPWNFPLAIFLGQVAAALVGGNCVLAKPAEQTPKIAYYIVKLAHECGVPENALHLLIGKGSVIGKYFTENDDITGVAFTGSTATARGIAQSMIARKNAELPTIIAETGGQNCMIVDSSALLEKACDDVIEGAFGSAGQRCSATRVVYIQKESAAEFKKLLKGAVAELKLGKANVLATDIPPVIDARAKAGIEKHCERMKKDFKLIAKANISEELKNSDSFVEPHIFEIKEISDIGEEIFGPVLHVIEFDRKNIDHVIDEINSTGYGLTFGIESRVHDFIDYVTKRIRAGNIYINRSTIGAVVETHPFGGMGLSGTGPKAGGVNYLKRFVNEVTIADNTAAIGGNIELII